MCRVGLWLLSRITRTRYIFHSVISTDYDLVVTKTRETTTRVPDAHDRSSTEL